MDLALDPLTGNRHLYAGANPTGMIDDGHSPYPTEWHPKTWSITGWRYSGRVSWRFEHFFTPNQYKAGGRDVWYRGKFRLDLDVHGQRALRGDPGHMPF